jgi:hypothetical protein
LQKLGNKKLSKAVSTKLTAEDYELCRQIAREFYIQKKIESPSVSELTRLALSKILDRHRSHPGIPSDASHPNSYRFVRR